MSIFLSNNVIALLFLESVALILSLAAFIGSIKIVRLWNFDSTSATQYSLEKRNYLISTIVHFVIYLKILLFIFFLFTIDSLSSIVPGAMCGSGVIGANSYGYITLILKLVTIFMLVLWLSLHRADLDSINYPYVIKKYYLFILIFLLIISEIVLEVLYFSNISLSKPVLCCSVTFGSSSAIEMLPIGLRTASLIILFYLFYLLIILSNISKLEKLSFISNMIFLFVGYFALTYFFGTYIYEIPTHRCPFCMLQAEYYYIGYVLWGSLILGTFFGMNTLVLKMITKKENLYMYRYSTIFNTIFVLLCTYFVVHYYLKNGVFL